MLPIQRSSEQGYEIEEAPPLSPTAAHILRAVNSIDTIRNTNNSMLYNVNNIMSGKSRYATVEDAVKDMQERTGLDKYLHTIKSNASPKLAKLKSIAQQIVNKIPESLAKYTNIDQVLSFVDNTVSNSNGLGCSVPQLQYDILHTFSNISPEDINNKEVAIYLNKKIIDALSLSGPAENNPNIGKNLGIDAFDGEGGDAWSGLMPAKGK